MAINPEREKLIPLSSAHRHGIERCKSTLRNWSRHGKLSLVTGERVRLEIFYDGHIPCTSYAAYLRFLFRLNGSDVPDHLVGDPDSDPLIFFQGDDPMKKGSAKPMGKGGKDKDDKKMPPKPMGKKGGKSC